MTDTVLGAIIGVSGAIFGVILAGPVTYYFSKRLLLQSHKNTIDALHIQEFIRAAIQFRSAFFDLLIFCQQPPSGSGADPHLVDFIIKSIAEQTKAALLFRAYLTFTNRFRFDQAWNEYSRQNNWNELNSESIKSEYGVVFYDTDAEKKMCHLVTSRIEKLFQFAPLEIEIK